MPDSTLPDWPGWERQAITIQTFLGAVTVDAVVSGHLAVHRGVFGYGGRSWTLTHVPSGLAITQCLPRMVDAQRVAEVAEVAQQSAVDWSQPPDWFKAHATDPDYLAAAASLRRVLTHIWHGNDGEGGV